MISILIPIYNFDASSLLVELNRQSKLVDEEIEIIVFDDHSCKYIEENKIQAKNLNISYCYLSKNIGRSRIRNTMSKAATQEFLLFLDGDVFPKCKQFIQVYINHITSNTEVIYGGRLHEKKEKFKHRLRWKYGYFKEDKTIKERQKEPYLSLITNNLLIKKSVFENIYFDESLANYGHEDTLFAFELKKAKATITHIENPVIHKDIDDNLCFLNKTEMALENLKIIYTSNKIPPEEIQLLKTYEVLKKLKLKNIFTKVFLHFESHIKNRLSSKHNSVLLFNIYKLGYFCKINRT